MRYDEVAPPPALAAHVRCIWSYEADAGEAAAAAERIVPDGRCELIVHFGAPYLEGATRQPRALFAGQLTRPLWLRADGPAGVLGVRFHAAGARRFLGRPLAEATDRRIPLTDLWAADARRLVRNVANASDASTRARIAAAFVAERIEAGDGKDDDVVARCVARLEEGAGRVAIEELMDVAGIGRRQLERRFRDAVGVPPRLFASILRFRRVFDALQGPHGARWTEAAAAAGYFDQSHLIRDCRRFLGCTPTQFLETQGELAAALARTSAPAA